MNSSKPKAPKAKAPKAKAPKPKVPKPKALKAKDPKTKAPKAKAPKPKAPKAKVPKPKAPKPKVPKAKALKTQIIYKKKGGGLSDVVDHNQQTQNKGVRTKLSDLKKVPPKQMSDMLKNYSDARANAEVKAKWDARQQRQIAEANARREKEKELDEAGAESRERILQQQRDLMSSKKRIQEAYEKMLLRQDLAKLDKQKAELKIQENARAAQGAARSPEYKPEFKYVPPAYGVEFGKGVFS